MNQKALLYIGGSKPQISGVRAAQESGLYVIATDRNADAPVRKYADRFEQIDAEDIEALLQLVEDVVNTTELQACYGVADYAFSSIGKISELHSTKNASTEVYDRLVNKEQAKKIWRESHIPVARSYVSTEELCYPIIVKPVDSHNSHGVSLIRKANQNELVKAIDNASQYSQEIMFEEYLQGTHVNVDILLINSKYYPVVCTERWFLDSAGVETFCGIQQTISLDQQHDLYELTAKAATSLGLISGPVTADVILTENGPVILELSPHFHSISTNYWRNGNAALRMWFQYLSSDAVKAFDFKLGKASAYCNLIGTNEQIKYLKKYLEQRSVTIVDSDMRVKKKNSACQIMWLLGNTAADLVNTLRELFQEQKKIIKEVI